MRNIFDQYSQPENKLTHALVCTLDADRSLLRPFLMWLGATSIPATNDITIVEQQLPGEFESGTGVSDERRGLPDAVFHDGEQWAFMIEAKIQSGVDAGQLRRHRQTAKRQGFVEPQLVVLAVDSLAQHESRQWREVYRWFRGRSGKSDWATRLTDYMEVFEAKALNQEYDIRGTITMFDGIRFDDSRPYAWAEGKRLIRLLGDELQCRKDLLKLGADPKGDRRSAISGRGGERVWDFIPLAVARDFKNFTDCPHLTMVIGRECAKAATTIPNGVKGGLKSRLRDLGADGFRDLLSQVLSGLQTVLKRSPGAKPMVYSTQRHYRSQRSDATIDGRLDADLAVIDGSSVRGVKCQPEWIDAIYSLLTNKKSNVQWGIEVQFSYDCSIVASAQCCDLFADSWMASKPLIEFVLGDN